MRTPSGGRARTGALALILTSTVGLLAGCIAPPVTATGYGVVTIAWASTSPDGSGAAQFNGTYGDRLASGADTAAPCDPDTGPIQYFYDPAEGDMSAVLSTDTVVTAAGGGTVRIPTGHYTLQAIGFDDAQPTPWQVRGAPLHIYIGPPGTKDLTTWLQSVARPSADAACPRGYTPSWAAWPNEATGGYVCNKTVYAYYPDEPVRGPGWDSAATQWQWSVERAGANAPCPDGFDPSWAQWPRDGRGGYVCVGDAVTD